MLRIGCHLSSSDGFLKMGKTALEIGANTFQYFTRNPRGGKAKAFDKKDALSFMTFADEHDIKFWLAHAPYTLNFCSDKQNIRTFARDTLADDLARTEFFPNAFYNLHPGSHVGQGIEKGIGFIADTINALLRESQTTTILLETMSGKGSEIGGRFEELREIIDRVLLSDKVGVCLDTCHVYDAGYNIVDDLDGVIAEFDSVIGINKLKAIHINDSKNPYKSHKDRHAVIGEGEIGIEALGRIINHRALKNLPFYLETPNDLEGYAREIALLKDIYVG